jgi:hypothetical protein
MDKTPRRTGKTQDAPARSAYHRNKAKELLKGSLDIASKTLSQKTNPIAAIMDIPTVAYGLTKYALNKSKIDKAERLAKKLGSEEDARSKRIETSREMRRPDWNYYDESVLPKGSKPTRLF